MLRAIVLGSAVSLALFAATRGDVVPTTQPTTAPGVMRVPVTITGGHDTDPRDRGRPVTLIAHALGVPDQAFRDAFSKVRPARGNGGPTPEEARANKKALMDALAPLGVTNERLDEVSNYYRYRRENGETWPQTPAEAYASIAGGKVIGVTILKPGSGYSSPPTVTIPSMPDAKLAASLSFDKDFAKNGAVASITPAARD